MSNNIGDTIHVACAIIKRDDKFFIARRRPDMSQGGKWEFPGGKIEEGESPKECLTREFKEEFGVSIKTGEFCGSNVHHYDNLSIELIGLYCTMEADTFTLTDHDQTAWVTKDNLKCFDLASADIPLIDLIQ